MSQPERLYRVNEATTLLQIGRNATYDLINDGKLRCVRIGRNIRIPESAIAEFIDAGGTETRGRQFGDSGGDAA